MWRARSIIYCAAFQGYVETDRGGIGPDGIRAMMFDRGYHDDDITDEYGKFQILCRLIFLTPWHATCILTAIARRSRSGANPEQVWQT
jgi:hypothetical protein